MKQIAVFKFAVVTVVAVLIVGGAVKIYSYTSPLNDSSASAGSTSQSAAPPCGYQDSNDLPYGCWAGSIGFIPAGYVLAPHYENGPVYPCPSGMDASQCKQFQASCGNGVCDPNETCNDCPIDCGSTGQLVCDQYTGRADESPIGPSVCQG